MQNINLLALPTASETSWRLAVRHPNQWTPVVATAARAHAAAVFLGFSRFPSVSSMVDGDGNATVVWGDMRFAMGGTADRRPQRPNIFTVTVRMDRDGRIVEESLVLDTLRPMHKTGILLSFAGVLLAGTFAFSVEALQQKGGEEETGPYDVVANWPQPWAKPGYIWGSQPGIFAESPNRIYIAARGELKLPDPLPRGFNGIWGSLGERATTPKAEMRNCLLVLDGRGKVIEAWTQWDKLFEGTGGPHKVKISPYDPARHVWVVNDSRHVIYEFTTTGKELVRTIGEPDVPGEDGTHFGSPQDLTFLADGSILVADGLRNSRVAKFDKNGTFVKQWGTKWQRPRSVLRSARHRRRPQRPRLRGRFAATTASRCSTPTARISTPGPTSASPTTSSPCRTPCGCRTAPTPGC